MTRKLRPIREAMYFNSTRAGRWVTNYRYLIESMRRDERVYHTHNKSNDSYLYHREKITK